jgi:hypothetical protein
MNTQRQELSDVYTTVNVILGLPDYVKIADGDNAFYRNIG